MSDYEHDSIELHREANDAYFGAPGQSFSWEEPCEEFVLDTQVRCMDGSPACRTCGWSVNRHAPERNAA